jgi:hypothetical protein
MHRSGTIVLLIVMMGCLSPIDFPVERRGNQLVISGSVSNLTSDENQITIGTTSGAGTRPVPVTDATVRLLADGLELTSYINQNNGVYRLPDGVPIIEGRTYTAEIRLSDGRIYRSSPEVLPLQPAISTAEGEFIFDETIATSGNVVRTAYYRIRANLERVPRNSFLRIYTQETWVIEPTNFPDPFNDVPDPCFVTGVVDPQRINLISTAGLSTTDPIRLEIANRRVDPSFLKRHYFTVFTSTISADTYEYWRKVNILANQVGSIFDVPPAEIVGNWQNVSDPAEKVWGYFQVANTTFYRFFVVGSEVPFFLGTYCEYNSMFPPDSYPNECLNCLSLPGSTKVIPSWWLD